MVKHLDEVQITEERPRNRRIAWWIENTLIRWVKRIINSVGENIRQIINFGIDDVLEDTEQGLINTIRPIAERYINDPAMPDEVRSILRDVLNTQDQGGLLALVGILVGFVSGTVSGAANPYSRKAEMQVDKRLRSFLFDPGTLSAMLARDIIDDATYQELMALNGVSNDGIVALKQLARPLLDNGELAQMMWRNLLSEEDVKTELGHYGYNEAQQQFLVELMEVIPSPNELISMAVREAFSDSTAARFGYDEDYPAEAAQIAEKAGYPERFFRYAWRAHWDLPGINQVREMWHRGIINEGDVDTYLKAADLPVFWRGKYKEWMYREVTRVDIRRIFALGLITPEEMYERYIRLGYNPDDATLMTEWTVANYLDDDRELTKADILSMYRDGILNYDEASTYLTALDYRPDAIALYLAHQDLKRQEEFESRIISNVEDLYLAGYYDRTDVFEQLGKLDTPADFIEQSLHVWDIERDKKDKIPTTAQLRDMAQEEIITWDTFREEMGYRGYQDKYITWYIELYKGE